MQWKTDFASEILEIAFVNFIVTRALGLCGSIFSCSKSVDVCFCLNRASSEWSVFQRNKCSLLRYMLLWYIVNGNTIFWMEIEGRNNNMKNPDIYPTWIKKARFLRRSNWIVEVLGWRYLASLMKSVKDEAFFYEKYGANITNIGAHSLQKKLRKMHRNEQSF